MFTINGQHRTLAAKELGLKAIDARIIDLSEHPDPAAVEAELRLRTNVRLSDRSTERFKAQIRMGNPDSVAIQQLLEKYETKINYVPTQDVGVNCVSTIESLYHWDQGVVLEETLIALHAAFGEIKGNVAKSGIIKGTAWFLEAHRDHYDGDRFMEILGQFVPAQWEAKARVHAAVMGKSLWFNTYRALVEAWNEKLAPSRKLELVTRGSTKFGGRTIPVIF
jgi:hypothetical protein